jgi:hypothetical protein
MRTVDNYDLLPRFVNGPFEPYSPRKPESVELVEAWGPIYELTRRRIDLGDVEPPTSGPWLAITEAKGSPTRTGTRRHALHRDLAEIALNPNSIADFARRFGPLGWRAFYLKEDYERKWENDQGIPGRPRHYAENVWDWAWHIASMRGLIGIVDAKNREELEMAMGPSHLAWRLVEQAPKDVQDYLNGRVHPFDVYTDWLLKGEMHRQEVFRQYLGYYFDELCRASFDLARDNPLYLRSWSLLGTAFIDLAEELMPGSQTARKCPGCGRWFIPRIGHKKHCNDSCRTRHYRREKERKAGAGSAAAGRGIE